MASNNLRNTEDISHHVTVLQCQGKNFAAKLHTRRDDGTPVTIGHRAGKYFKTESISLETIHDMYALQCELQKRFDLFIIRGQLNPVLEMDENELVRRAKNIDPKLGETIPYFVEVKRRWVMLDFDKIPNPLGLDSLSEEAMRYLVSLLPAEFHDVTFCYCLSSSAGLSDNQLLSAHVYFYLNTPLGDRELKRLFAAAPVDRALFNTVQPHYTAAPLFSESRIDPVEIRKGLVQGVLDQVKVPKNPEAKPRSGAGQSTVGDNVISGRKSKNLSAAVGYESRMEELGDGPGGQGCHGVITPAIAAFISEHGPGFDREALKEDIRRRAASAYWDRSKHSEDYVQQQTSDRRLDDSIDGWLEKTFTIAEAYSPTRKTTVSDARSRLSSAIDAWIDAADRWRDLVSHENEVRSSWTCHGIVPLL